MFKLLKYLGEYKKYAILTMLIVAIEAVCEVSMPFIMSLLIEKGIGTVDPNTKIVVQGDIKYVFIYGGAMIVIAFIALFTGMIAARFAVKASQGFAKNLREAEFNKIQDFSFANVDKFSTASLVTRLTTDVTYTAQAVQMSIRLMIRSPIMLVFATIMAILLNPSLSVVFIIAIPLLIVFIVTIMVLAFPHFKKMLKKYDDMNAIVQEDLIGARVVKAFVRKDFENNKFVTISGDVLKTQVKAERLMSMGSPLMQIVMYGCMIGVALLGGRQIIAGTMPYGQLTTYISYVAQILMSLMMISMFFINLVMSRASMVRINEVLSELPDINDDDASEGLQVLNGEIEFNNVNFSYSKSQDSLTLENVNLKIKSGETIGIIGGTGSSKTTFVQLIPRLYDVLTGEVVIAGHNVKSYKIRTLRDQVAMVLQKNVLFSGTIKENLRWGKEDATDEELIEACKKAQAHDFISSFPDGYDTKIEQGGTNVSGGQKQRLCIARALLKNPKIIILDDSTSAVDTATDSKIRAEFKKSLSELTTIIIAQRVSSIKEADRIIVLNNGAINGVGTHEELISSNEIYQEVYHSQTKGEQENATKK